MVLFTCLNNIIWHLDVVSLTSYYPSFTFILKSQRTQWRLFHVFLWLSHRAYLVSIWFVRPWSRAKGFSFTPTLSPSAMMHALWVACGLFLPLYHFRKNLLIHHLLPMPPNKKGGWEEGWKGTRVSLCGVHLTHRRSTSWISIGIMCLILLKSNQTFLHYAHLL